MPAFGLPRRSPGACYLSKMVRQGILCRVPRKSWDLGVGILGMTHDAFGGGALIRAITTLGACLPPDLRRKMDTKIAKVAAGGIPGIGRSAHAQNF